MLIGKKEVFEKLKDYLEHKIEHNQIVKWAEDVMQEDEFDDNAIDDIRAIIALIGFSDVKAFGLTWEDCENMLSRLGYSVKLKISPQLARA